MTKETLTAEDLQKAEELLAELKRVKEENAEILAKNEELASRNLLSGTTDAAPKEEKPKVETPTEYAKRIASGIIE